MRSRRAWRLLAASATGALVLSSSSVGAGAQAPAAEEVSAVIAQASGISGYTEQTFEGVVTHTDIGLITDLSLPPEGGALQEAGPGETVMFQNLFELPVTSGMELSVEGAVGEDGFATATAAVRNIFSDAGIFGEILQADLVEVECQAIQTVLVDFEHEEAIEGGIQIGTVASTTIQGGTTQDLSSGETVAIPESPEPNMVLVDFEHEEEVDGGTQIITAHIFANEQVMSDGEMSARGLHVHIEVETIPDEGEPESIAVGLGLGFVRCGLESEAVEPDPEPDPEPDVTAEPRFTG